MFKKILLAVFCVCAVFGGEASADDYVRGYYRSNGTYVAPHYRSHADGNFYNNWSTYPNINPYTGKMGTRVTPPYWSSTPFLPKTTYPSYSVPSPSFPSYSAPRYSPRYGFRK